MYPERSAVRRAVAADEPGRPVPEIAWQLAKALAFLLNAADRSGDHAALMEGLGQVSDSTAIAASRARAVLAAGVLALAADRAADRENRTALGDSLTTRVTAELLTADEHGDSYGGPRDLLDMELTGDSIAVKSELHGTLATDARALLDWDAVLRALGAAYDRATTPAREHPDDQSAPGTTP